MLSTVLNAEEAAANGPEIGSSSRGLLLYLTLTIAWQVLYLHFTGQESEAQRGEVTCPETPSWKGMELDLYCGPPDSGAPVLCSVPHISGGGGGGGWRKGGQDLG